MKTMLLSSMMILSVLLLTNIKNVNAQESSRQKVLALGVRLQIDFPCLSAQFYLSQKNALELLIHPEAHAFVSELLYEFHLPIQNAEGFGWFIGPGINSRLYTNDAIFGVVGIIGLEYTFAKVPFNLSLDWKPSAEVIGGDNFYPEGFGASFRWMIGGK